MSRHFYISMLAAVAVLFAAGPAMAGGVIHEIREVRNLRTVSELFTARLMASQSGGSSTGGSSSSSSGSSADNALVEKRGPIGPVEIAQIQAGLITEEEAAAGCGGASAATGPAGLLPLVVAGAALLRRRRS